MAACLRRYVGDRGQSADGKCKCLCGRQHVVFRAPGLAVADTPVVLEIQRDSVQLRVGRVCSWQQLETQSPAFPTYG